MDIVEAFKSTRFWIFQKKGGGEKQRKKHRNDKLERIYGTPEHFLVAQDEFAVDDIGEIIYVEWKERLVCGLKDNGEIEFLLKLTGWEPWAVCCSISRDILVGMRSVDTKHARVVGYQGNVKTREYKLDHKRQALFGYPMFLRENGNLDVCVSDSQYNRVTVVDCKGALKYYHGNQAMAIYPTFYQRGIATNSQCDILVADQENNCVHIIDTMGQFIRFISSKEIPLKAPFCIQVGSEDELYVGEYHQGTIKKITCNDV